MDPEPDKLVLRGGAKYRSKLDHLSGEFLPTPKDVFAEMGNQTRASLIGWALAVGEVFWQEMMDNIFYDFMKSVFFHCITSTSCSCIGVWSRFGTIMSIPIMNFAIAKVEFVMVFFGFDFRGLD